jgi:hypothetical protein
VNGNGSVSGRIVTIADGVRAAVIEHESGLPRTLDGLLGHLLVVESHPYHARGTRRACTDETHEYTPWLRGVFRGLALRLSRCLFCGCVEVRDQSIDLLPDLPIGRQGPRRRDAGLGWYAGKRAAGRTYL